jgi:hypothetical protein
MMSRALYFISRLPFTFFALAAFLAWQVYRIETGAVPAQPQWQVALYIVGAALGFLLGLVGLRERHRRYNDRNL